MSRARLVALLLALTTLVVYAPVMWHDFINYDDGSYVYENAQVQNGLTWAGVKWAFTAWEASNWHPLTWLSHMLDCELFGLNPGPQHFVNVLFHTANTILLFSLLLRLTKSLWPSALVAALFAWHPLHVESIAWISERKDVLSTFFALLSLLNYARFIQENLRRNFWFALIFFALSLMSKPMFVTLPFVMLLLDYWPLKRFEFSIAAKSSIQKVFVEKIPFFALTFGSCVITYLAQKHGNAVRSLTQIPLIYRLENAPVAIVEYLFKTFWPAKLAIIYPMPDFIPTAQIVVAVAILFFITIAVWLARKKNRCWLVGWFWFLGTLVPVIGIVKVGDAAFADRYTYFPIIGIFLALVFGLADFARRFSVSKIATVSSLILIACLATTENQLHYWRNDELLFKHALDVTKDNADAEINYGVALEKKEIYPEALVHYREAARLAPDSVQAHNNLGNLLDEMGQPQAAIGEYQQALRAKPNLLTLHDSLGEVLVELRRFDEAMIEFTNAAQLDPQNPWPHFQMAKTLLKQGRDDEALGQFHEALRLSPDNFQILAFLAHVLAATDNEKIRDGQTALELANKANELSGGTQPFVLDTLAMAYATLGQFDAAQETAQKAVDLALAYKIKNSEPLQQRLELYKNHQPWRESFLATKISASK